MSYKTVSELRAIAAAHSIELPAKMKKDDILQALMEANVAEAELSVNGTVAEEVTVANISDVTTDKGEPNLYSLSGILSTNFHHFTTAAGVEKVSTFLTNRPMRTASDGTRKPSRNQYVTMSRMTFDRLMERVEKGEIDLKMPIRLLGLFFPSKSKRANGNPLPDGFHVRGMRPAIFTSRKNTQRAG